METNASQLVPRDEYPLAKTYPISVNEDIGISPLYQRMHWHDVLEINMIKKGTGYYIINGQLIEFHEGDILLINSNDLHRAYERQGLDILVISFDASWLLADLRYDPGLLAPFKEMGFHYTNLLLRDHPRMGELRSILLKIQNENQYKEKSFVSIVRAQLLLFLAYIGREFRHDVMAMRNKDSVEVSAKQLEKMRAVITVMEQRYGEQWDLQTLSKLIYLSPSRFSALFKQTVGVSPLEYLIQIRLSHAVRMLEDTEIKIVDIAYECGFHNLSNFNRLFKCNIGISPRDIRERIPK
jgi:AraC-like DNA-binding protein